ncbi:hypothetical protein [Rossellomorea aquimaris]|uniref:hypothetical protein n=1 Tax=Rossellomorea aquimaris TaxID=189382 RepID=UPI0012E0067E|nr:hypothetical protein [Rossellomorea aquimaris]
MAQQSSNVAQQNRKVAQVCRKVAQQIQKVAQVHSIVPHQTLKVPKFVRMRRN